MKKILVLSNGSGGLFGFRRELMEELCAKYEVIALAKPTGNVDALEKMGCRLIPVNMEYHGTNPIKELKLVSYYKKKLRELQPDVVLTYTIKPNIYGGIACGSLGIPYFANVTGLGTALEGGGALRHITVPLYRRGLKKAQKVFFQNQSNLDFMLSRKIVSGPYELLPGSGVNLDRNCLEPYPEWKEGDPLILTVIGRMIPDKGIREILTAARRLSGENIRIRLIGTCEGPVLEEIKALEPEGVVSYLGYKEDPRPWYKHTHAVLHASYHEGMSNVLLEAAACGRPVLATNVPGCRETYVDGISGLGFPPKDADALYKTILKFRDLPWKEKRQMGLMGRKHVEEHFDRNIIVNTYLREIGRLV